MKNFVTRFALVVAMLAAASSAHAAMYTIDGNFGGNVVDTTITTSDTYLPSVDGYNITNITGTIGSFGAIASLVDNPNKPFYFTDQNPPLSGGANLTVNNVWSATDPYLTGGVVFLLQNGMTGALWENSPGNFGLFLGAYNIYVTNATATVSEVPLPPALLMFLAGTGLLGLIAYRRNMKRATI